MKRGESKAKYLHEQGQKLNEGDRPEPELMRSHKEVSNTGAHTRSKEKTSLNQNNKRKAQAKCP